MDHLQLCKTSLAIAWCIASQSAALSQQSNLLPLPVEPIHVESGSRTPNELDADLLLACLRIPSSLIATEAQKSFQHSSPIDRVVLGTHARGTASCEGDVRVDLQDHVSGLEFVCCISGVVTSQSCGVNGPATISSTSDTTYTAEKRILFDGRKLSSQPATICATTRVKISGIGSTAPRLRGRLVTRIASRRVTASLPEVQEITRQLTVAELQKHIDDEFAIRLAMLNRKLDKRLSILDAFPRNDYRLSIRSTTEFIEILLIHHSTPDAQTAQDTVKQNTHKSLPSFPAADNIAIWIQLPEMNLLELDSLTDWRLVQVFRNLQGWLSAPLSNTQAESDADTPRVERLRLQNWIGFQLDRD